MSRKIKAKEDINDQGNGCVCKSGTSELLTAEALAQVSFSIGYTINLGNYESKRIDIGVTRPCVDEDKEITKVFKALVKDVNEKIDTLLDKKIGVRDEDSVDLIFMPDRDVVPPDFDTVQEG